MTMTKRVAGLERIAGLVIGMLPLLASAGSGAAVATAHPVDVTGMAVVAPSTAQPAPAAKVAVSQTELWLQIQVDGQAASNHIQQATPTERELSFQRLLESFKYPIPESFERTPITD